MELFSGKLNGYAFRFGKRYQNTLWQGIIMSGLIRKSSKDYFIIAPMRKLPVLKFATNEKKTALLCKNIEVGLMIVTVTFLFAIYKKYDGLASIYRLLAVFIIVQPMMYILMWFFAKDIEKYSASKHGNILN